MEQVTSPVTVNVNVSSADGYSSLADLVAVRAVSLTVADMETARVELTVVVADNDNDHHVVRFPAEDIGRVLITAGVNMYEELPGRLLYAADLSGDAPLLVNPFVYTAVRGTGAPLGTPPGDGHLHEELEGPHVGHNHG